MDRFIEQATQFPYHSFKYEMPTKRTDLIKRQDYLLIAEHDHPLRGNRYRVYWAANSSEALIDGLTEMRELLKTKALGAKIFVEHIPAEFVIPLEEAGLVVVSEWVDFWIHDLPAVILPPLPSVDIRLIAEDEHSKVAEVARSCMGLSREFYGETDEAVMEWLADDDTDIFVAEVDGKIVGACWMAQYGFEHPKGSVAWLRELTVAPEYHSKGVGRALSITGLNWGLQRGAKRSFLSTDVENHHAIRLYEGLGYRRNEERGQINMTWMIK